MKSLTNLADYIIIVFVDIIYTKKLIQCTYKVNKFRIYYRKKKPRMIYEVMINQLLLHTY